jgi:oligosaccharyltransferase complex subunit beta
MSDRGYKIDFDSNAKLFSYDQLNYDHLILFASKYSKEFSVSNLINYVNAGGNILLATHSDIPDVIKDFSIEFSVDFDDKKTSLKDPFHSTKSFVYSDNFVNLPVISNSPNKHNIHTVIFNGIAHRQSGKNPLVFPVLRAEPSSFSFDDSSNSVIDPSSPFVGSRNLMVSAHQTRLNSRIVFAGTLPTRLTLRLSGHVF